MTARDPAPELSSNAPPPRAERTGADLGSTDLLRGAPDGLQRAAERRRRVSPPFGPWSALAAPLLCAAAILVGATTEWSGPRGVDLVPPPEGAPSTLPRHREAFRRDPPHGLALGLYSQDPDYDYGPALAEIAMTGANAVELVVNHYQLDHRASFVGVPDPRTPPWWRVRRTIEQAHDLGLAVHLMPIVLLRDPGPRNEHWRGTIDPTERDTWHLSYRRWIVDIARRAQRVGVEALCVGSEFNSMQGDGEEWRHTVSRVRSVFGGAITYSANWDSYAEVAFLDTLDALGMTTYHPLARSREPELEELIGAWLPLRSQLIRWQRAAEIPMFFTEVGYPSTDGAAMHPWDYTTDAPVDLMEQRDCFEAFTAVWQDVDALSGVFFYVWWGVGGPLDRDYTPRGKPALEIIERWFRKHHREDGTPRTEQH